MFIDKRDEALRWYRGSYFRISKDLIRRYGIEIPTFLEILIAHQENLLNKDMLDKETGQFYVESDKIEDLTALTYKQQWKLFNILEHDFKVLRTEVKGMPPKKFITIDFNRIKDLVTGDLIIEKHLHVKKEKATKTS